MSAGTGMIMGAGFGIVFAPILGPLGIVVGDQPYPSVYSFKRQAD